MSNSYKRIYDHVMELRRIYGTVTASTEPKAALQILAQVSERCSMLANAISEKHGNQSKEFDFFVFAFYQIARDAEQALRLEKSSQ